MMMPMMMSMMMMMMMIVSMVHLGDTVEYTPGFVHYDDDDYDDVLCEHDG